MSVEMLLGELWRIGLTLAVLLALLVFWYFAISTVTPFRHRYTPSEVEQEKERAARYARISRYSVRLDVLFFVWLVVEGAFLVPWLLLRYGPR